MRYALGRVASLKKGVSQFKSKSVILKSDGIVTFAVKGIINLDTISPGNIIRYASFGKAPAQATQPEQTVPAEEPQAEAVKTAPIDRDRIDWTKIEQQWGITRDDLEKSGALDQMVYNHKSPQLFTVTPRFGDEKFSLQAKLSFRTNPDGSYSLVPHFVRNEPQLDRDFRGYTFTKEDKAELRKTGNLGKVVELADPKTGEMKKCLVSIDRLTNEIDAVPVDKIFIRPKVANIDLDMHAIGILKNGGMIREQNVELPNGAKFTADLQYNAAKRDIVFVNSVEQQPTRKYATVEFKIGEATFFRQWEITGEAYDVTETGTFHTGVNIKDAGIYPCDPPAADSNAFSDVMCAVTSKAEYVDDIMHTNVPYTQETNDYGSALGNLVRKGLLVLDGDSVYLSPEGQYVYDEFAGMEIDKTLLTWQFEANDLYEGDQTGRSVINGFSGSLLGLIDTIDPDFGL